MPHIRMTVDMLRAVGAQVDTPESGGEPNVWRVTPGALLGRDLTVEPDLSNAQPFLAAALVTGGRVTIPDWPERTTQPGDALREIFTEMGGSCELTEYGLAFTGTGRIHGIDVDLGEVGELTPGIAAVAALADSPSTLRGVAHLRLHETDRLAALTKEINELGGDVTETDDGLHIRPRPLHGGIFHTYDDHRMATAGAIIGLAVEGVQIENVATTAKTLPDFPRDVDRNARGLRRPACAATASTPTRTTSAPAPTARATGPVPTSAPSTRTRSRAWSSPSTGAGSPASSRTAIVMAMKARELGRKAAVVGDRVGIVGDLSGEKDTLARIVRIEERTSVLRRTADDDDPYERVVVANADQLAIVTALADPEPRPRLIDRCLVAAYDGGLDAAPRPDQVGPGLARQAPGDVRRARTSPMSSPAARSWWTAARPTGCASTSRAGSPRSSATPASARRPWSTRWSRRSAGGATGHVNAVTGRGRHTTTSALALPLRGRRAAG